MNLALSKRRRERLRQQPQEAALAPLSFIPLVDLVEEGAAAPAAVVIEGEGQEEGWACDAQGNVRVSEAGMAQRRVMRRARVGVVGCWGLWVWMGVLFWGGGERGG